MARRLLILLFAFLAMIVGIEGIHRLVALASAVLPAPTFLDLALIALLPAILWLWWRYASPFGKERGHCLTRSCRKDD